MEKATFNGLKMPLSVSSVAKYIAARDIGNRIEAEATGWEDIPEDIRTDDDLALELVESGQTAWHLPYFHVDICDKAHEIYFRGKFEIARFFAKHLIDSLPDNPIDPETKPKLEAIRDGKLQFGRLDSYCSWPQKPEFYRKTLNWRMVGIAEEAQTERRAEDNTHWLMIQTGRGYEYAERKLERLSVTGENQED
jgi:hypothetical protein